MSEAATCPACRTICKNVPVRDLVAHGLRSLALGNADVTIEPTEPFDSDKFVGVMERFDILGNSDESEDGDGDAIMVAAADVPGVGTYLSPLDLSVWGTE
jgi:hypothetical protein